MTRRRLTYFGAACWASSWGSPEAPWPPATPPRRRRSCSRWRSTSASRPRSSRTPRRQRPSTRSMQRWRTARSRRSRRTPPRSASSRVTRRCSSSGRGSATAAPASASATVRRSGPGGFHDFGELGAAAADYLDLTEAQLHEQLQSEQVAGADREGQGQVDRRPEEGTARRREEGSGRGRRGRPDHAGPGRRGAPTVRRASGRPDQQDAREHPRRERMRADARVLVF